MSLSLMSTLPKDLLMARLSDWSFEIQLPARLHAGEFRVNGHPAPCGPEHDWRDLDACLKCGGTISNQCFVRTSATAPGRLPESFALMTHPRLRPERRGHGTLADAARCQ